MEQVRPEVDQLLEGLDRLTEKQTDFEWAQIEYRRQNMALIGLLESLIDEVYELVPIKLKYRLDNIRGDLTNIKGAKSA